MISSNHSMVSYRHSSFCRRKNSTHKHKKKLKFGTEHNSNAQETEPENTQVGDKLDEPVGLIGEQIGPDLQMEQNEVEEPGPNK